MMQPEAGAGFGGLEGPQKTLLEEQKLLILKVLEAISNSGSGD